MRRVAIVLLALMLALGAAFEACGAQERKPERVSIAASVRERLAEEWHPENRYEHERGYCVTFTTWVYVNEIVYRVYAIRRADERGSSPVGLTIACPDAGPDVTILHTHPANTCPIPHLSDSGCQSGGETAYHCEPSPLDRRSLRGSGRPFALIQCDRNALVPYYRK